MSSKGEKVAKKKAAAPKALKEPKPHKPTYAANKRSEVLASRLGATAGDTLLP